jgi:hypothetical protein
VRISCVVLTLLFGAGMVWAQSGDPNPVTGTVLGQVRERVSQQVLPGANVTVEGTRQGATTGTDGTFRIDGLAEDVYAISVSFIGYEPAHLNDVRVVRGKVTVIPDIELAEALVVGDEIVVTSGFFENEKRAPVSTYNYTREEIWRSPGAAGDVFRALETLPGVSSAGGEFSSFSVRGGSPKDNVILIDNIPFDRVTHFTGGSTEEQDKLGGRFSIFAPNLVEKAEFQAGGFSAIYGGKNASILHLEIREGNPEDRTVDGRIDVLGAELNYSGPLGMGDDAGLLLSVRRQDFTRILELTGQGEFGSPRFLDAIGKATIEVGDRHKVSFLGILSTEAFDRDVDDILDADRVDETSQEVIDYDEDKALAAMTWRNILSSGVIESSLYYRTTLRDVLVSRAEPSLSDPADLMLASDFSVRDTRTINDSDQELGVRSIWTHVLKKGSSVRSGMDWTSTWFDNRFRLLGRDTLYVYDQSDRRFSGHDFVVVNPADVDNDFKDNKNLFAAFTEFSLAAGRLSANLGVRYEYSQFSDKSTFSPRASASYDLGSKTRLSLAGGVYYQTPDFQVLARDPRNLELSNEHAVHLVGGLTRYFGNSLKWTAEGYVKRRNDLVVWNDRSTFVRSNDGEGWTSGVDLSLVKRLRRKFYGQVNYSYSWSEQDDNNGEQSYPSDFNQPHLFNILGGYEFNKDWTLSAKWKYATGRPADRYVVNEDVFGDPGFIRFSKEVVAENRERLPDFHTFNIRVDYRKQFKRFALVNFLDVVNVYNYLNVNEARFLPLTGLEDERGFKILPTMGSKIEF